MIQQGGGGIIPLSAIEGKLSFFAEVVSNVDYSGHNVQYKSYIKFPYDSNNYIFDTVLQGNSYRYYVRTYTAQRIQIHGAAGNMLRGFAGGDISITINGSGRLSCQELNILNFTLYTNHGSTSQRRITPGTVEGGKFYFYKSDINGVQRHNIIPVLANGECNLYDTITDQFVPFTHEGTLIPIY